MHHTTTRSRFGKVALSALVGTVLSIGAVSGAVSAAEPADADSETTVSVAKWDHWGGGGATSMRSGIRW